jgi:hypothetical protein
MRTIRQSNHGAVLSVVLAVFGAVSLWAICAATALATRDAFDKSRNQANRSSIFPQKRGSESVSGTLVTSVTRDQPGECSPAKPTPVVTTHPSLPSQGLSAVPVANTGSLASEPPCKKASDSTRRVVAYAVLGDGTEAVIYGSAEVRTPTNLPGSGAKSAPSCSPTVTVNSTYVTGQRHRSTHVSPYAAENGSYYGQISDNTDRPKTVYVRGYYRSDGTYVRSHYRSSPRR